jgi:SAM-dependent methyltransferase
MRRIDFPWPLLDDGTRPEWTGDGFVSGGRRLPMLTYAVGDSGWSDGLTKMHEDCAGSDHPIDRMSRSWAASALRRHVTDLDAAILDIGCSSGLLVAALRVDWPSALIIASDFVPEPLERLAEREPGLPVVQFDIVNCPLPSASVEAVVMLNVLEHIADDWKAVDEVARILKPGGVLVVEVPAGPHLYDVYDEYLQHERRYTAQRLASLLRASGLTVLEQSHLGFSVYPAFAMTKRRNQRRAAPNTEAKRRVVGANIASTRSSLLLRGLLGLEAWLGRLVSFPFGIRSVAVAQKTVESRP